AVVETITGLAGIMDTGGLPMQVNIQTAMVHNNRVIRIQNTPIPRQRATSTIVLCFRHNSCKGITLTHAPWGDTEWQMALMLKACIHCHSSQHYFLTRIPKCLD